MYSHPSGNQHMNVYESLPAPAGRTIIVGDIHGCWQELADLLDGLRFSPEDLLISVGDLVDRGPDSWRVARFFRTTPNAHTVLGNHERRVARHVLGGGSAAWSQLHTLAGLPAGEHEDWARWLLSRPVVLATPAVVVVHARLDPRVPLDRQDPLHACAVGGARIVIERDEADVPRWFHDLDEPRCLCIGHLSHERVELVPGRLYALDTGCCSGGRLTALVLPEGRVVSVDARGNHAAASRLEWEAREHAGLEARPLGALLHLLRRLEKQEPDRFNDESRIRIRAVLDRVDLAGRQPGLQAAAEERWGVLPASGPARGEFLRRVADEVGDPLVSRIVAISLRGKVVTWPGISRYLGETTVEELEALLGTLERAGGP